MSWHKPVLWAGNSRKGNIPRGRNKKCQNYNQYVKNVKRRCILGALPPWAAHTVITTNVRIVGESWKSTTMTYATVNLKEKQQNNSNFLIGLRYIQKREPNF